jgi:hypothetical protein
MISVLIAFLALPFAVCFLGIWYQLLVLCITGKIFLWIRGEDIINSDTKE